MLFQNLKNSSVKLIQPNKISLNPPETSHGSNQPQSATTNQKFLQLQPSTLSIASTLGTSYNTLSNTDTPHIPPNQTISTLVVLVSERMVVVVVVLKMVAVVVVVIIMAKMVDPSHLLFSIQNILDHRCLWLHL
jgi:hypothetical protein